MTGRKERHHCARIVLVKNAFVQYALREHLIHLTKNTY
jgi:hypothetical protein